MIREEIKSLSEKSIKNLKKEGIFSDFDIPEIIIEIPENKAYGDYSTNVAMVLAKVVKKSPMEIAKSIKNQIRTSSSQARVNIKNNFFEKIEIVKPGFINFFISKEFLQGQVSEILKQKEKYEQLKIGKAKKVNVEFISANPTGPLTLGNGRGGFGGDVLANVLEKAGYKVTREYYINDTGEQIRKLGHSVLGDEETVYKGDYILKLREKIKGANPEKVGEKAAKVILREMIRPSVKEMGIKFDVWFSEKSLYKTRVVEKALVYLKKKGLAYEKDGALWFKSTEFGDDKDRVLVKADGEKTYLASDVAYLKNKFKRGFKKLIYIWGADHFGYISRIKAATKALGYKKEDVEIIIMQLVKLFEAGKEVRMSKRTGVYVTLDELIDEVGLDVARFFFLTRSPDSHLNFDLDLAKEQSEKNPVYYVQYAHARISSIFRKIKTSSFAKATADKQNSLPASLREALQVGKLKTTTKNLKLLNHSSELHLIKQLIRYPEIVEDVAKDYQVQRLPQYAVDLATALHQFYRDCRVIPAPYRTCSGAGSEDKNLTQARLGLVLATKIVLENTLDLMGISAPEKM